MPLVIFRLTLTLVVGFVLAWAMTFVVRIDPLYQSVHSMGERFSQVVPVGHDIGTQSFQSQYVRIEPSWYYQPQAEFMKDLGLPARPRTELVQRERTFLAAAAISIVVLSLLTVNGLRRRSEEHSDLRVNRRMFVTCVGMTLTCVLAVGVIMCFRLFLTGVDDGLIERGAMTSNSPDVHRFNGNQTLAMSFSSLVLLYSGAGMLLYIALTWIGIRSCGPQTQDMTTVTDEQGSIIQAKPLRYLGVSFILAANLALIFAPWTCTMLGLFIA